MKLRYNSTVRVTLMFRLSSFMFGFMLACVPLMAQNSTTTADCTFDDGRQISLQYTPGKSEEPRSGKMWEPGGTPMVLFAQAPLKVGGSSIGAGAYTVYLIPGKKEWTLIVNKNVAAGSKYDSSQDLARTAMETGEIDQPQKSLQVAFAHMAPKVCSLRLYYGKIGAFAELNEQ